VSWVNISTNDVLAVLNNSETSAYQKFRTAPGQSDPLATLIGHVTGEVRAIIGVRVQLDAGGGIPQSLVGSACALVAYRLIGSCNAELAEKRKPQATAAQSFIDRAGKGEIRLEQAVTPLSEPDANKAPIQVVHHSHRKFTDHQLRGL
jgi:hypothetical protein